MSNLLRGLILLLVVSLPRILSASVEYDGEISAIEVRGTGNRTALVGDGTERSDGCLDRQVRQSRRRKHFKFDWLHRTVSMLSVRMRPEQCTAVLKWPSS